MAQIIESIPNISEGRNQEVIEACVDQIRTTPGCTLLNYSSDPNHNRTVITYIGDAKGVEEASVKLAKKAVELIDLNKHTGEHPRMGCVDVMPFVPIKEATNEECVELSKVVGKRIAEEADLPVFLYEMSGTSPTEAKEENTINPLTAIANPRQIERVVRGAEFPISIIYNMSEPDTAEEDFRMLAEGFRLLQYDYIGGHGSRGYGRIEISDLDICCVIGDVEDSILDKCGEIIGAV